MTNQIDDEDDEPEDEDDSWNQLATAANKLKRQISELKDVPFRANVPTGALEQILPDRVPHDRTIAGSNPTGKGGAPSNQAWDKVWRQCTLLLLQEIPDYRKLSATQLAREILTELENLGGHLPAEQTIAEEIRGLRTRVEKSRSDNPTNS